jgi:hypothetical protein
MKNNHAWILYIALVSFGAGAVEQNATPPASSAITATEASKPRIIERWTDGRVWQRTVTNTLADGRTIVRTNRVVDLATGMHYWDVNHWKESRPDISIVADGAEARQGPHKVHFAGNINSVGAITVTSRDAKTFRLHVLGLAYTDMATGQSVLIAGIRDSIGQLFLPNQVLYANAFSGVMADIRYAYARDGFEQDVILRENPAPPSSYGLDNESSVLEVWTEFVEAPEPVKRADSIGNVTDETLSFGKMRMMRGGAFALDAPLNRMSAAPVGKTWLVDNGRRFLIESVRHSSILAELQTLPQLQAALKRAPSVPLGSPPDAGKMPAARSRLALLNEIEPPKPGVAQPVRLAIDKSLLRGKPGLVLDFVLLESDLDDYTFQCDTEYLISGGFNIWGTLILEGGVVIKVATTNDVVMQPWGNVICKSDPYRPIVFTSQNDTTIGTDLSSPGSSAYYHGILACGQTTGLEFKHLKVSYALYGLQGYGMKIRDSQFISCSNAFYTHYYPAEIDNVLFYKCGRIFNGARYTNSVRHITVNECAKLTDSWDNVANCRVAITNSLLVNVTNNGSANITTNYTVTTTGNIFQTVGAAAHYLLDPSPYRDAGTTNIPAAVAARLRKTTTYPPLIMAPGGYYEVSQTLYPRAGRDTDLPDLGAHYDPLDYAISFVYLTNATLRVEPGTALGVFNPSNSTIAGLYLGGGAQFLPAGRADSKVMVTHYATVQEMANTNWNGPITALVQPVSGLGSAAFRCRFTDFTGLAGSTPLVKGGAITWEMTDCQFHGGSLYASNSWGFAFIYNSLFNRTVTELRFSSSAVNEFRNCTYYGGTLWLDSPEGVMTDCLFDGTRDIGELGILANPQNSKIGYTTNSPIRLETTNANDVILTSLAFQTGPLGYFYIPSNALWNAGSRNATSAGLYHYTMLTNQVKETNTTVDIGFHYAATDANGTPLDYDGDGVPDYWEDINGNGTWELTELDWKDSDTDNDGVPDGEEILQGRNPLGGALADTNNVLNLRVFTPLK